MAKSLAPLSGSLTAALLAILFCLWTALGNDVNICVTTGCTLYEDFSIAGISLWWVGVAAFTILAICALLGQAATGRWLAGLMLACDACLLALMAVTAPCVNCLIVALFFAMCYWLFRRRALYFNRQNQDGPRRPSFLLWIWLVLYIVNIGQVARSQVEIWPIMDESGEPVTRMFFSPSCRYCVEGIKALSGNVSVAFYPVAENEADVAQIGEMFKLIESGEPIATALARSDGSAFDGFWAAWRPASLLLRFRLLGNKAHLFARGSQGVPFFEHKGLMPGLREKAPRTHADSPSTPAPPLGTDHTLPVELQDGLQCGGLTPCPPGLLP